MSLWVLLYEPEAKLCDHCGQSHAQDMELFSANITHNLNTMADKAGIYEAIWEPEKIRATKAKDIIAPIEKGLQDMKERPQYYEQFNPSNGWGDYEGFISWIEEYLEALKQCPNSMISANG